MKSLFASLLFFTALYGLSDELRDLPWVYGDDVEALLYSTPFLPDNPVIIEAGTASGDSTLEFIKMWPKCTIYGFEACPSNYDSAQKLFLNHKNVHIYPYALSNINGEIEFYVSQANAGTSSLLKDNFGNISFPDHFNTDQEPREGHYQDSPVKIEAVTLNSFLPKIGVEKVDYIWLDTEGAELLILTEATQILKSVRVLSLEINFQEFRKGSVQFPELHQFLISQGFSLKYIWSPHLDKWQGGAIYLNNKILNEPLNLSNEHLFPKPIAKDDLYL